jgi:hypothetical protein
MQEEIWKDVPGYEGYYQVSSLGQVKSLHKGSRFGKVLHNNMRKGYYSVSLCKKGTQKSCSVHIIVAISFLNHTPNGFEKVIDHINNNPLDNRVENLQIVTQRFNSHKDQSNYSVKSKGVNFIDRPSCKKAYRAKVTIKGKILHLGYFVTETEASNAYKTKIKEIENDSL